MCIRDSSRSSCSVAPTPRLSSTGFSLRLRARSRSKFCILRAPIWMTSTSANGEAAANEVPTKSRGEIIVEEAMGKPMQKEGTSHQNPSVAKTDKSTLSERDLETTGTHTDKGVAKEADKKPSVKAKLDRYKAAAKEEKEAELSLIHI